MIRRFLKEKNVTWEFLWSEVWNLFKFGVVGGTSLGINAGVYALLSRVLWTEGNRTFESVIAVTISAVYNFTMHRTWTFKARGFNARMVARYIGVVVAGSALTGTLFYIGHEVLKIYDFIVLVGSAFLVAGVSYFTHRLYTFHPRHDAA
ncbi:hypothetical protein A3E39_01130 [Candidatus Uhrbacteria bacterium RIFCSPHIGHO2_12_FULL_60_25]|uniref:GtrA/DPMS transmembrane domain-containing protein n=1 Tax=Candidatus Uhrbacteria bacterium RIFCSPHIGHO2_12_FULL_60_25 TaxID=1802399 RepID=A0A1F7UM12_9BACT|nr:MAG: hypothetical protein A3D73_02355 [Candidatus Uhrbacteria bacterium RIFCSPHIGHO2_02_FULL_60_44]OGL78747.1 MAG: hypothetical protein A3E39_01130 [Candidatus Uhrbacteria bacterium RIFCSPHIGHO2_12_FULL_60_25]